MKILNSNGMKLICDNSIIDISVRMELDDGYGFYDGDYLLKLYEFWVLRFNGIEIDIFDNLEEAKKTLQDIFENDNVIIKKVSNDKIPRIYRTLYYGDYKKCEQTMEHILRDIDQGYNTDIDIITELYGIKKED